MNDTISNIRYEGSIAIDGNNIFDKDLDVVDLRKNVGMVFQKSIRFLNLSSRMSHMDLKLMVSKTRVLLQKW